MKQPHTHHAGHTHEHDHFHSAPAEAHAHAEHDHAHAQEGHAHEGNAHEGHGRAHDHAGHASAHGHDHHGHAGHGHGHPGHDHHGHHHGPGHSHAPAATASNKGRILLAAVLTAGFMVAEAVGGVLTGSLALLADAGHMLTDSVALILAYVAYRMSERRGTARLTYGFDRLKILVAYTNALTVLAIAVWIVIEAVQRFADPAPVLGAPMLAIAGLGLLVNIAAFVVLMGGDRGSLNLRGALIHVAGDMLGSVAAIVAALIILTTGWTPADPILSVLVAMLLLRSAWAILRESGHILLEGVPPDIHRDEVAADLVTGTPGVFDVHHMHIWSLDGRQQVATLHARLEDGSNPQTVIAALKARLRSVHRIEHATIEIEDMETCADDLQRAGA